MIKKHNLKSQKEFLAKVDEQCQKTVHCIGYKAFKVDVDILKIDNQGSGLRSLTANVWLKKICELTNESLFEYVDNYVAGTLKAWNPY